MDFGITEQAARSIIARYIGELWKKGNPAAADEIMRVSQNLSAAAFFAAMDAFFASEEAFFAVGLKLLPRFPAISSSSNAASTAFFRGNRSPLPRSQKHGKIHLGMLVSPQNRDQKGTFPCLHSLPYPPLGAAGYEISHACPLTCPGSFFILASNLAMSVSVK
jgi:hypothetical protein